MRELSSLITDGHYTLGVYAGRRPKALGWSTQLAPRVKASVPESFGQTIASLYHAGKKKSHGKASAASANLCRCEALRCAHTCGDKGWHMLHSPQQVSLEQSATGHDDCQGWTRVAHCEVKPAGSPRSAVHRDTGCAII